MSDPISDMLIQIKNAYAARNERVLIPCSKAKIRIVNILLRFNFIDKVEKKRKKKLAHLYLDIKLKYNDGTPAMSGVKIISKPARRLYAGAKDIKLVKSGNGISIISTSKGVMTGGQARKLNLGGEMICEIW